MKKFLFLLFMVWMISPWSVSLRAVRAETNPQLAILPFFVERSNDPARGTILCPICKRVFQSGTVVPGSENYLTRLLYQKMEALEQFKIVSPQKLDEILIPSVKKNFEEKPVPSSIQIAKELDAKFILVGYLFRFEERVGSSIGVEKPASVGFDVHLFRIKDGAEVWKGGVDETQRPLSENLLQIGSFLRRKASWLTAEELSGVGMEELLKRLPGQKELEEKR